MVLLIFLFCNCETIEEVEDISLNEMTLSGGGSSGQISYDWSTHSWINLDPNDDYGVSNTGVLPTVNIVQGDLDPHNSSFSYINNNYYRIRIPVAEVTKSGTILILTEGRLGTNPNYPPGTDRDYDHLILSRSTDFGATWTTNVIFTGDANTGGEDTTDITACSMVADKMSSEGKIFILAGVNYQNKIVILESDDDGCTWTKHHQSDTDFRASTYSNWPVRIRPNNGIQMKSDNAGDEGNLIVPGVAAYDDDLVMATLKYDLGTDTWAFDQVYDNGTNALAAEEMTMIETVYGNIRFITRPARSSERTSLNQDYQYKQTLLHFTYGSNPSTDWIDTQSQLPYLDCNQNLRGYSSTLTQNETDNIAVYSSTMGNNRHGGEVFVSWDQGYTFPSSRRILHEDHYFGYSQIVTLPDGSLGVAWEGTNNQNEDNCRLQFKRVTLGWITQGAELGFKQ